MTSTPALDHRLEPALRNAEAPAGASLESLTFANDGAFLAAGALDASGLEALEAALAGTPPDRAGVRLHSLAGLDALLAADGAIGRLARLALRGACRPVRAILFDKTAVTNWSLGWHQDRTIVVRERRETEGFGPWTTKWGLLHVEPPYGVLAAMATLRVHLDPVPPTNAPLLIAPSSHRLGRIPQADVPATVERCGAVACLADAGDVWVYSTPILHASEAAVVPRRRRVLQVDYAGIELAGGLEWLGI